MGNQNFFDEPQAAGVEGEEIRRAAIQPRVDFVNPAAGNHKSLREGGWRITSVSAGEVLPAISPEYSFGDNADERAVSAKSIFLTPLAFQDMYRTLPVYDTADGRNIRGTFGFPEKETAEERKRGPKVKGYVNLPTGKAVAEVYPGSAARVSFYAILRDDPNLLALENWLTEKTSGAKDRDEFERIFKTLTALDVPGRPNLTVRVITLKGQNTMRMYGKSGVKDQMLGMTQVWHQWAIENKIALAGKRFPQFRLWWPLIAGPFCAGQTEGGYAPVMINWPVDDFESWAETLRITRPQFGTSIDSATEMDQMSGIMSGEVLDNWRVSNVIYKYFEEMFYVYDGLVRSGELRKITPLDDAQNEIERILRGEFGNRRANRTAIAAPAGGAAAAAAAPTAGQQPEASASAFTELALTQPMIPILNDPDIWIAFTVYCDAFEKNAAAAKLIWTAARASDATVEQVRAHVERNEPMPAPKKAAKANVIDSTATQGPVKPVVAAPAAAKTVATAAKPVVLKTSAAKAAAEPAAMFKGAEEEGDEVKF